MSDKVFEFKEFSVKQEQVAMKVGTDGVLLGAWVDIPMEVDTILDIGTGTGLIALQMAQRSEAFTIDAIEIEPKAFETAVENFEESSWADRLFCYHASFQEFVAEMDEPYDLIISNPPYFNDTYKELEKDRALARHTKDLSFHQLLQGASKLLAKKGSCAFIIPFKEEADFIKIAKAENLYPSRITRVKGNAKSSLKRSLLQFTKVSKDVLINELTIEIERHVYTDPYIELVKDFYLKM